MLHDTSQMKSKHVGISGFITITKNLFYQLSHTNAINANQIFSSKTLALFTNIEELFLSKIPHEHNTFTTLGFFFLIAQFMQ